MLVCTQLMRVPRADELILEHGCQREGQTKQILAAFHVTHPGAELRSFVFNSLQS